MTVKNWRKKIVSSLVAAGLLSPAAARAVDIPLSDAGFETYAVPAIPGYAYSTDYRPTSAWVDDLDSPGEGYFEDDGITGERSSNWLYDAAYAEVAPRRAAPRTGDQAMHGITHYSAQETSAVFEAGKTYTFSIYSQGDFDSNGDNSRVWLYLFDADEPFSEAASLSFKRYGVDTGDFANRTPTASAAQSQALWQKISLSHTVQPGAPEVGHTIGVGFWGADDAGLDDASLAVETSALTLIVNTVTGATRIVNETGQPVNLDYYQITSAGDSLNKAAWNSLQDQNAAGFPAGNGSGNGWEEAGAADDGALGESFLTGNSQLAPGAAAARNLGAIFSPVDPQDLVFNYGQVTQKLNADFDSNLSVDGGDLLRLQRGLSSFGAGVTKATGNANTDLTVNGQDLAILESQFGNSTAFTGAGAVTRGVVRYVTSGVGAVPEPSSVILAGLAGLTLVRGRRRIS